MMSNFLITVLGPTAIGKTALSLKLAEHFNTTILSADSRQFFKEMYIGTAVPSDKELNLIKHYFIQHKSIKDPYDVGQFEREAIVKLDELFTRNNIAILVGGSGLYVNAVTNGLNEFPKIKENIRNELNRIHKSDGLEALQIKLKELDPTTYDNIDIDNPHRVIRALEVCISSGRPFSSYQAPPKKKRRFNTISIGLTAERETIYSRINLRVDKMMHDGLLAEAKELYKFKHLNALNTVGYKELFKYFEGECSLDEAVSEIKKNTRRFAKRQLTWFRKDNSIKWFNYEEDVESIIRYINLKIT